MNTLNNPFTIVPASEADELSAAPRPDATTLVTPYDVMCAEGDRPAAFVMTFLEPTDVAA